MVQWYNLGSETKDLGYRTNFVRIMHGMDSRYLPMRESQLADWLKFPCQVRGYEADHLYAYAGFRNAEDVGSPERMRFAVLFRHIGANHSNGDSSTIAAELLMVGWTGASTQLPELDDAINALIDKGLQWLTEIKLSSQPIQCFRPYEMANGSIRALHDRVFVRTQMTPPNRIEMRQRTVLSDGELWKLVPLK